MREERARILGLLHEGKITVDEAELLLSALGSEREEPSREGGGGEQDRARRLCVRITDTHTGKVKVNVRLPSGAWGLLSKLTRTKLGRRIGGLALHDIQRAARSGESGHIIDTMDADRGERVEIFFE